MDWKTHKLENVEFHANQPKQLNELLVPGLAVEGTYPFFKY